MTLKKIFENNDFIVYEDNKGFDFAYDIENKTGNKLVIRYGEYEETIEIGEWLGLFPSEKYIIECILNEDYEIL